MQNRIDKLQTRLNATGYIADRALVPTLLLMQELGREGYRPDEEFMRLAAPFIELLAPAHSVAALEDAIQRMATFR